MSEQEQQRSETPPAPPPIRRPAILEALRSTDPVSIGALFTAIMAGAIGAVQTAFMWDARNDQVEAALRAQQLHACVTYRTAGVQFNARAQEYAAEQTDPDDKDSRDVFDAEMLAYQNSISELGYLLPASTGQVLDAAEEQAIAAAAAFNQRDYEALRTIAASSGAWSTANNAIIDRCDAVIRDVRDH